MYGLHAGEKGNGPCPHCGFDENKYEPAPHHLPLRTILNGKYLAGKVLGEGGFGITYLGWDLKLEVKLAIKEYYPNGFVVRNASRSVTLLSGQNRNFSNGAGISLWTRPNVWGSSGDCRGLSL